MTDETPLRSDSGQETQPEEQLPTLEETAHELQARVEQLERERGEYLAGWKRAKSDLLVFQQGNEERLREFAMFAQAGMATDLLSIIDSFDLALHALSPADKETSLGKGYYLIQTQLTDLLRKYGVEQIEVTAGQRFEPALHEAIDVKRCTTAGCDGSDDQQVVEVLSRGYRLHGKLLRPAKVRVITHADN